MFASYHRPALAAATIFLAPVVRFKSVTPREPLAIRSRRNMPMGLQKARRYLSAKPRAERI
jgi:hypothetical protein